MLLYRWVCIYVTVIGIFHEVSTTKVLKSYEAFAICRTRSHMIIHTKIFQNFFDLYVDIRVTMDRKVCWNSKIWKEQERVRGHFGPMILLHWTLLSYISTENAYTLEEQDRTVRLSWYRVQQDRIRNLVLCSS